MNKRAFAFLAVLVAVVGGILAFKDAQAAPGPNLIGNPSLETASTSPAGLPLAWYKGGWGTNSRVLSYPVAGFDGTKAARVEITSYSTGDAKWFFENVAVTGGRTYEFSSRYKSTAQSYVTIQYRLADGTFRYSDIAYGLPPAADWTEVRRTFTVPTGFPSPVSSVTVFHLIKSVGVLDIDAYELRTDTPSGTGTLVVVKHVVNDDAGTSTASDFRMNVSQNGTSAAPQFAGSEAGTALSLQPGTYRVSEIERAGYRLAGFSGDCDAQGSVTISGNATSTCTLTNDDVPSAPPSPKGAIKVNVSVRNDNGQTKKVENFTVYVDAVNVKSGESTEFEPGEHVVSQIADPEYTTVIGGDCDAEGKVTVAANESKTCTVVNDDVQPAPPPPSSNLIKNPSAETASSNASLPLNWFKGGWGTNARSLTYPAPGYDGAKSMRIQITSYSTGDAKWFFEPVPVSPGQQYSFSNFYTSDTTSYLTAQYQLQDGSYRYVDLATNVPASAAWTELKRTFTVPTYASPVVNMTIFHLIKSVGTLQTDAYSLSLVTPPPGDPGNAVPNPGVENASGDMPASWMRSVSSGSSAVFTYPVAGHDSARAVSARVTSYSSGAGAKWYFQSVPVAPGDEYEFSDWFKSDTESFVVVQFALSDGTYSHFDLMRLAPSSAWKEARETFIAPPKAQGMTVLHLIKSVGTLTTDDYRLRKLPSGAFSEGMVSLSFDDGLLSIYENALPILRSAGLKSTQYIITGFFDEPGYVNSTQVKAMAAEGHEIAAHTRTHAHLLQLTASEQQGEIDGSRSDLAALGLQTSNLAFPYGEYDDVTLARMRASGWTTARTVRIGFNSKNTNPLALVTQHVENDTTVADFKTWIDHAKATKTWLVLELHGVDYSGTKYSTTPEILRAAVDYIKSSGIKVVTNAEGRALLGQ